MNKIHLIIALLIACGIGYLLRDIQTWVCQEYFVDIPTSDHDLFSMKELGGLNKQINTQISSVQKNARCIVAPDDSGILSFYFYNVEGMKSIKKETFTAAGKAYQNYSLKK